MRMRLLAAALLTVPLTLATTSAFAATPDYGTKNPTNNSTATCSLPYLQGSMLIKCLPSTIPWTVENGETVGVHIVRLPISGSQGNGFLSFWCYSHVGFKYMISVTGLDPHSTYTVTLSTGETLGVIHTNGSGSGQLNGVQQLAPGMYEVGVLIAPSTGGAPVLVSGGGFAVA